MYKLFKVFNLEIFQGGNKRRNYFEGWYYKLVDQTQKNVYAIIPGVSFGHGKVNHAFIQIFDAGNNITSYVKFNINQFEYSKKHFKVTIGNNIFERNKIVLDLESDIFRIVGSLEFQNIVPFPKSLLNPGIMGPFSFVPFMECYHGIINIQHDITGILSINNRNINFTKGYGYLEKDWGKSFPEAWVWIQSNHFSQNNVSFMFSIAKIPWMGGHFTGFVSFLRIGESFYRFASYTNAKIKKFNYENNSVDIVVADSRYSMSINAEYSSGGSLMAPKNGNMDRKIIESLTSEVLVVLRNKNGDILFNGRGINVGMEIAGSM